MLLYYAEDLIKSSGKTRNLVMLLVSKERGDNECKGQSGRNLYMPSLRQSDGGFLEALQVLVGLGPLSTSQQETLLLENLAHHLMLRHRRCH